MCSCKEDVRILRYSLIWRRHHCRGEGLQNLGLCSALRAFEQGGISTMPHPLRNRVSASLVSSEGPVHSQGGVEDLVIPDPHSIASYDIESSTGEELQIQNSEVSSHALRLGPIGFEQGGVFIVPHLLLLRHEPSVFPVSSKGPSAGPPPLSKIPGSAYEACVTNPPIPSPACFLVISVGGRTAQLLPQFCSSSFFHAAALGAVQGTGKF
jgi:hypothetical protein